MENFKHYYYYKPKLRQKGFSLIELMVVVSIVSLISMMSLPQIAIFNIRAAQAEMSQNTRIIYTHVISFNAESDAYPAHGGWGKAALDAPTQNYFSETSYCDGAYVPPGGLRITNCDRLRYLYVFYPPGTGGGCALNLPHCFSIDADGSGFVGVASPPTTYMPGGGLPTRWCKNRPGYSVNYHDRWLMDKDGILTSNFSTPFYSGSNAAKNCFE